MDGEQHPSGDRPPEPPFLKSREVGESGRVATGVRFRGLVLAALLSLSFGPVDWHAQEDNPSSLRIRTLLQGGQTQEAETQAWEFLETSEQHGSLPLRQEDQILVLRAIMGQAEAAIDDPLQAANEIARNLYQQSIASRREGDYEAAEQQCRRTLLISKAYFGPEDSHLAWPLNGLAILHDLQGDYVEARRLYEAALSLARRTLEPGHPFFAPCLNNLGLVYRNLGNLEKAEAEFREALRLQDKGDDDLDVASYLKNLAEVLQISGQLDAAKPLYQRALRIRQRHDDVQDEVASTMTALAGLYRESGDYDEALKLYDESRAIWLKVLPEDHLDMSYALYGLAAIHSKRGDYEEAIDLYRQARAIREKRLGAGHPLVAETVGALSVVLALGGKPAEAVDLSLHAESARRDHIRLTTTSLTEEEALDYSDVIPSGLDLALTLTLTKEKDRAGPVLDAVIQSRALVLDEMAIRRHLIHTAGSSEIQALARNLESASSKLAKLFLRKPGELEPTRYQELLEEAREQREEAERALAQRSAVFRQARELTAGDLAAVRQALPAGSALLSFVQYRETGAAPLGDEPGEERFAAFVLRHDSRSPVAVSLGGPAEVQDLVAAWIREAGEGTLVQGRSAEEAERRYRREGERLRREIWDPVAPYLEGIRLVFVVPDGPLALVNFYSLPVGDARYLIDEPAMFHYLSAERDLLYFKSASPQGHGLLAMGSPDFDREAESPGSPSVTASLRAVRAECADFASIRFEPLAEAEAEIHSVMELWRNSAAHSTRQETEPSLELVAESATETAFKRYAPGKRVIHLATHGFFLGDACRGARRGSRGIAGLTTAESGRARVKQVEDDLLLSGLALAGANRQLPAGAKREDGILTAAEIGALDLGGVQWAVLSACETGQGATRAGEGVFGFRRAFQVAGVRTVIMSLWSVEEMATRYWMERLYTAFLEDGLNTVESIHQASLDQIDGYRRENRSTHPFYWAPFIAVGDWKR